MYFKNNEPSRPCLSQPNPAVKLSDSLYLENWKGYKFLKYIRRYCIVNYNLIINKLTKLKLNKFCKHLSDHEFNLIRRNFSIYLNEFCVPYVSKTIEVGNLKHALKVFHIRNDRSTVTSVTFIQLRGEKRQYFPLFDHYNDVRVIWIWKYIKTICSLVVRR